MDVALWRALAAALVGYAFLLRLLYAAEVELLPEETYYWNYSRHLDIGYLDHPPMVAWLIRLGTTFFGDTEFGVRFGALGCGAVAGFFVFRLTRNIFGARAAWLALVMSQSLPFFFLSGMLMTPDAPLTAAWAASLYFLERALFAGQSRAWIWAGLSIGIGFISKYTMGLLVMAAFVFMCADPPSRRWFRRPEPYLAALLAAAVFGPVILWNAQHDWLSFAFQTSRRLADRPQFALHKLIGAALILLTPVGLFAISAALLDGPPRSAAYGTAAVTRPWRFMQWCVWLPVAVFVIFSLRHEVKLDWTGAPWSAALPVMAFSLVEAGSTGSRVSGWLRAAWLPTLIFMLLLYGAGLYYLALGIHGVGYSKHTEWVPVGWRDFGRQIDGIAEAVRAKYGDQPLVVGMDRYAIASEIAFYSPNQARAVAQTTSSHLFDDMGLMYELWFPAARQAGRTMLLVAWTPADLDAGRLEKRVAELGPLQEGVLTRDGSMVRRYYYRVARGYRAPD